MLFPEKNQGNSRKKQKFCLNTVKGNQTNLIKVFEGNQAIDYIDFKFRFHSKLQSYMPVAFKEN